MDKDAWHSSNRHSSMRDGHPGGVPGTGRTHDVALPCFLAETLIRTADGDRPVEELDAGDMLLTRDHGFQPLLGVVRRLVPEADMKADGQLRPVQIAPSALGQHQPSLPLRLLPNHRVLLNGFGSDFPCAAQELFVAASYLLPWDGVSQTASGDLTSVHLGLADREVLLANGAWTECFKPRDLDIGNTNDPAGPGAFTLQGPEAERAMR